MTSNCFICLDNSVCIYESSNKTCQCKIDLCYGCNSYLKSKNYGCIICNRSQHNLNLRQTDIISRLFDDILSIILHTNYINFFVKIILLLFISFIAIIALLFNFTYSFIIKIVNLMFNFLSVIFNRRLASINHYDME